MFTQKAKISLRNKRRKLFIVQNINNNLLTHNNKMID